MKAILLKKEQKNLVSQNHTITKQNVFSAWNQPLRSSGRHPGTNACQDPSSYRVSLFCEGFLLCFISVLVCCSPCFLISCQVSRPARCVAPASRYLPLPVWIYAPILPPSCRHIILTLVWASQRFSSFFLCILFIWALPYWRPFAWLDCLPACIKY